MAQKLFNSLHVYSHKYKQPNPRERLSHTININKRQVA